MKKAFSLIELSIVVLIIGILIAGVVSSSRLVTQIKISSARSLTASSPVPSVSGLVAWYETTQEASFDPNIANQDQVAFWNDINPQSSSKINLTQSNTTYRPTYIQSGINGIPSLSFNTSHLQVDNLFLNSNYTYFVVFKRSTAANTTGMDILSIWNTATVGSSGVVFEIQQSSGAYLGLNRRLRALHRFPFSTSTGTENDNYASSSYLIQEDSSYIASFVRNLGGTGGAPTNIYINGNIASDPLYNGTTAGLFNASLTLLVGNLSTSNLTKPFLGMIGEIIIYDRALKTDEIADIHKYLSKKFSIKIN
ncbi:MAG: LamG-like jellyroll fold domain-containing protein [Alphaproteobacteria bacterium]